MTVGINEGLFVVYHNNLNVPVTGIVVMTVHNNLGQQIYYTADYLTINASSTAPAPTFLVEVGLANGNYSASVFAFASPSGVAITNTTVGIYPL